MNPDWTVLTCTFASRGEAIALARQLGGNPELDHFPQTGWLNGIRYDIADIGEVRDPEGGIVPGWHFLGVMRCRAEDVPAPLMAAHVDRSDLPWWPRWG